MENWSLGEVVKETRDLELDLILNKEWYMEAFMYEEGMNLSYEEAEAHYNSELQNVKEAVNKNLRTVQVLDKLYGEV